MQGEDRLMQGGDALRLRLRLATLAKLAQKTFFEDRP